MPGDARELGQVGCSHVLDLMLLPSGNQGRPHLLMDTRFMLLVKGQNLYVASGDNHRACVV